MFFEILIHKYHEILSLKSQMHKQLVALNIELDFIKNSVQCCDNRNQYVFYILSQH
jgi:hypothetical protein